MVADEVVYIGSKDHILYALDTRTDNKLWNYTTGILSSTTSFADGFIYVSSFDATLYALESVTGALLWKYTRGNAIVSSLFAPT